MSPQNWKKLDPANLAMLRDDLTDKSHATAANNILPDISPEKVIQELKGMIVGDEYRWAETTLRGILKEVERTQYVTVGQWQAVEKIYEAKQRHYSTGRQKNRR